MNDEPEADTNTRSLNRGFAAICSATLGFEKTTLGFDAWHFCQSGSFMALSNSRYRETLFRDTFNRLMAR